VTTMSRVRAPHTAKQRLAIRERLDQDLVEAVKTGQADLVQKLLSEGANPNATCKVSRGIHGTALCAAARAVDPDMIKLLIAARAMPTRAAIIGTFGRGKSHRRLECFRILLALSWDVDRRSPIESLRSDYAFGGDSFSCGWALEAVLREACSRRQTTMVKHMLDAGIHPDMRDKKFWESTIELRTCLNAAVEANSPTIVDLLLASGADPNRSDMDFHSTGEPDPGLVPLHHALKIGASRVAVKLIKAGADIELKTSIGTTPLMEAAGFVPNSINFGCQFDHHIEPLKLLIRRSAVNARDRWGRDALSYAAAGSNPMAAKLLLKAGARVAAVDRLGMTALHHCSTTKPEFYPNRIEIAALFLEVGADLQARNSDGETPTEWARSIGDHELASWFEARALEAATALSTVSRRRARSL
jgi:ankyrin repeat protein